MPKFGKALHKLVHQLPRLELAAHVQPLTRTSLRVDLSITPDFAWDDKVHGAVEPFWVLVEDADGEALLHHQLWLLRKAAAAAGEEAALSFTLPVAEPLPPQYFVRVVSDRWLSCEAVLPISFRHLILPEKFAPPTELLDLQPLPVTALRDAAFEALYTAPRAPPGAPPPPPIRAFNAIQTQAFNALYHTDDNVLLAAPTGSGKTIAAEFALLRMLQKAKDGKGAARCVYVAPLDAIVAERAAEWRAKFGPGGLGLTVEVLTGESAADLKRLERAQVVLASAQHWDMLSRRWKQRKNVQATALFVVDELHLIGGAPGPTLEVVCSRMRYISAQRAADGQPPVRIVGLAHSLANARDVGEWLGAGAHALFNFAPGVRPVPLEIHIQGVDVHNFEARMQAMARPAFSAVCRHAAGGKPALVFAPSRRHARLAALELMTMAAADGDAHRFRLAAEADLAPHVERLARDKALAHAVAHGVGYVHEGMDQAQRAVVEALFESGAIQVLVATAAACWGLRPAAALVVVMGTQYFDNAGGGASAGGGADYPVADLVQMVGRASRPGRDDAGRVLLMCAAPRKEYYKKFLLEPLPVESHLDGALHDAFVAEVVARTIESKQDAVDWLTWTFYYRRLSQNPNYYNLTGASHRHLSDHLSDLVEATIADLEQSKVVAVEDEMDVAPLNLGMIAAYYYIAYTTVELFAASLTAKTKLKGLLEIVSAASEFDALPVRPGEELLVERLLAHAPVSVDRPRYTDPHTKANALLQAHFSRVPLSGDLAADQRTVVQEASRLLQAAVDVIASSGWLSPALAAMEMSQMVAQALWERDSPLLQLPGVTPELAAAAAARDVEGVFGLIDMDDEERRELLQMSEPQLAALSAVCARYPDVSLSFEGPPGGAAEAGEQAVVTVSLERDVDGVAMGANGELPPVHAPRFPGRRDEGWWLVLGDAKANKLLAIKRVSLAAAAKAKLAFEAPAEVGDAKLTLFFMSDSWLGCDQEYELDLKVTPSTGGGSGSGDDE